MRPAVTPRLSEHPSEPRQPETRAASAVAFIGVLFSGPNVTLARAPLLDEKLLFEPTRSYPKMEDAAALVPWVKLK